MKMFIGLLVVAFASVSSVYGGIEIQCPSTNVRRESLVPDLERTLENTIKCWLPSQTYCCIDVARMTDSGETSYKCCTKEEAERQAEWAISAAAIAAIIAIVVIVLCCSLCVACLRCTFCPVYKYRNPGTVYVHASNKPGYSV